MASSARIDELQKKFDENPRRYFAPLANEYRKAGQLDRAIALCREHLPKQPGHMSGHIVYGQALYEAGEPVEARRVFQTALDLDPENVIALRHMGDIDRASGDVDEARHWYTRVLDADPRNAEVTALIDALASDRPTAPHAEFAAPPLVSTEPALEPAAFEPSPADATPADATPADVSGEPSVLHPEEFEPGPAASVEAVAINADLADVGSHRSDEPEADPFLGAGADPAFGAASVGREPEAEGADAAWPFAEPLQVDAARDESRDAGSADAPELLGAPGDDLIFHDEPRGEPLELIHPDAEFLGEPEESATLRAQSALEGLVLLEPVYDANADQHATLDAAPEPPAFADVPLDAPLLEADARADDALGPPTLDAAPGPHAGAVAGDEPLPSVEAFAYDAPPLSLAADPPADVAALAAVDPPTSSGSLPSIDDFAYDAVAEGAPDEGAPAAPALADAALLPSIVDFVFVGPSIDEFLVDEQDADADAPPAAAVAEFAEREPSAWASDAVDDDTPRESVAPEPALATTEEAGEREGAVGSPFVTETMAELYLRQGFRDEALGVYRQLLASDPYNAAISAKVRELTGDFASVPAPPPVADAPTARSFFAALATRRAPRPATPASTAPPAAPPAASPSERATTVGGPTGADGFGFGVDELDAFVDPASPGDAGAAPDAAALRPIEAYGYDVPSGAGAGADPGSLDALFGHQPVGATDAAAATALAAAFGAAGDVNAAAAPLDEMFRRAAAEPTPPRRATPTAFSFEQFFTDEVAPPPAAGTSNAAPPARFGEESPGDLDQFNSWLDGLKRK